MGQDEGAKPNSGHIAALTALQGLKIAMFMLAELGLCLSVSKLGALLPSQEAWSKSKFGQAFWVGYCLCF